MKITVAIPLFNKAPFIRETIYSVLEQSHSDFELIIIDDGSTDGSQEVVRQIEDKRIRFIQNERNLGTAAIANKLMEFAESKYVVRIDADDIMMPNRIQLQLDYMEKNPEIVVSSGSLQCFGEDQSIWTWPETHDQLWSAILFRSPIVQGASIINSEHWKRNNFLYDENGPNTAEDWLMWYKVARKAKIGNSKEVLIKYRVGPQNISQNSTEQYYKGRKYLFNYMFNDLNLPQENIDIHFLTRPYFLKEPDKNEIRKFYNWLKYLREYNDSNLVFDKHYFNQELENRWNKLYHHLFKFGRKKALQFLSINKWVSINQLKYFISYKSSK